MPIDASIPLSVRAPQINILDNYGKFLGIQQQKEASAALAEQRQAIAEQRRQATAGAQREQEEATRLQQLFSGDKPPSTAQIYGIVGPERGAKIVAALDAVQDKDMKRYTDGRALFGTVISGLKALPEALRAETYQAVVGEFSGRGWLDASQIQPYSPEVLDQYERELMSPDQRAKVDNPAPYTLTPGAVRYDGQGNKIAEVPTKPESRKPERVETVENGRPVVKWVVPEDGQSFPQYVKPDAPRAADTAPVAVMGPNGQPVFVPRAEAIGKQPANMREQGRNVTSGDAGRIAEFDTSLDDVKVLRDTISESDATGTVAKIGASLPNWATELTGWTGPKKKQAVIDRVKQVIGKALEGGVLRKEDEYKYEKILPTIADQADVVRTKLDGLETALAQRRQRFLDSLEGANFDVSNYNTRGASGKPDPLGIR